MLLAPKHDEVMLALNEMKRVAYVSPTAHGKTVVYDQASDTLDLDVLADVSCNLSSRLDCPALGAAVFDDDVLCLQLFDRSRPTVNYVSRGGPRAGAWRLCCTLQRRVAFPFVWLVMVLPFVPFEYWRHAVIAKLLGIPEWVIATGYEYIRQGEPPPGLTLEDFDHIPD